MEKEYKRRLNIRPMFMLFLGLMIGVVMMSIFFVYSLTSTSIVILAMIITIVVFCLVMSILLIWNTSYFVKTYAKHCLCFVVAFFLMVGYSGILFSKIHAAPVFSDQVILIGTIANDTSHSANKTLRLTDVKVVDNEGKSYTLHYDVELEVYQADIQSYPLGMVASYYGYLDKLSIKEYWDKWVDGIGYQADAELNVTFKVERSISQEFKLYIKNLLQFHMTEDLAGLCYGSLFGEKVGVDYDTKQAFTSSGLGHLLAVSGLHISFFVGLLTFFLKKIKCSRWVRLGIIGIFLLIYCHLCGYSPSCIRASVMSMVMLLGYIVGWQYDTLSALGVAGCVILLLSPFSVFDIGFQMSFLSIVSIITLYPTIQKILNKTKFPSFMVQSFAITIGVNFCMIPAMIVYFEKIYVLSLFSNMLAIPIFGVAYSVLVIVLLMVLCMPFLSSLFILPSLLFHAVKYIAVYFSTIPFATIPVFSISLFTILCMMLFLIIVKFYMCSPKMKYILSTCLFYVIIGSLVFSNIPTKINQSAMYLVSHSPSIILENHQSNKRYLIGLGSWEENNYLTNYIKQQKMYNIDSIFYDDLTYQDWTDWEGYQEKYHIKHQYVPSEDLTIFSPNLEVVDQIKIGDWWIRPFYVVDRCIGYEIETTNQTILLLDTPRKAEWETICQYDCDIMIIEQLNFSIQPDKNVLYYVKNTRVDKVQGVCYLGSEHQKVLIQ